MADGSDVIDLSKRRARAGAQASEMVAERAVHEILMSIHSIADSAAALRSLARSLADLDVSAVDFGQAMQMVINRMLEIEREASSAASG